MWLACAARRKFRVFETDRRRFEAVTDQWRFATGADRQSAAIAAVIDQAAVLFCPDGELRLFCFDEKSSLNIRWRRQLGVPFAAYSVVCPWWLAASSYKKKMYFR
jgi:hypothetical protein